MQLRERIVPKYITEDYPDIADLILRMTEPQQEKRIDLDELAEIVDASLDDYQHLRCQISTQEQIIKDQSEQIAHLLAENHNLKQQLQLVSQQ